MRLPVQASGVTRGTERRIMQCLARARLGWIVPSDLLDDDNLDDVGDGADGIDEEQFSDGVGGS